MRVGLIGSPEREELQRLALRLEERGSEGIVLDPAQAAVELTSGGESAGGQDLARFKAFYVADLRLPPARDAGGDPELDERARRASQRHLVVWNSLLERLARRARVVNPPATWELHALKPWEMAAYRDAGLPAPRTVSTSSPQALVGLVGAGPWIRKGLVGGYGYTTAFEPPTDVGQARALLAGGPLLAQRRIMGENVRAFVVNGELIGAAEIVSAEGDGVDSRSGPARARRLELPAEAARAALAASALWSLRFSAVDLMRDAASGAYSLLECNSAPFFVNFERLTGIDVSSPLADCLIERRRAATLA